MEVTNRFKALDLVDRVPDELRTEIHDIVQELVTKTTSRKALLQTDTGDPSGCPDSNTLAHPPKGSEITQKFPEERMAASSR